VILSFRREETLCKDVGCHYSNLLAEYDDDGGVVGEGGGYDTAHLCGLRGWSASS